MTTKDTKSGTGRPRNHPDDAVVCVSGKTARTKLQDASDRKAIVLAVLDNGGRMTVRQLVEKFAYDVRPKINTLISNGWLEVKE